MAITGRIFSTNFPSELSGVDVQVAGGDTLTPNVVVQNNSDAGERVTYSWRCYNYLTNELYFTSQDFQLDAGTQTAGEQFQLRMPARDLPLVFEVRAIINGVGETVGLYGSYIRLKRPVSKIGIDLKKAAAISVVGGLGIASLAYAAKRR